MLWYSSLLVERWERRISVARKWALNRNKPSTYEPLVVEVMRMRRVQDSNWTALLVFLCV